MGINAASSALHLNLPSSGSSSGGRNPSLVTVHPSVLAQILEHHTRRNSDQSRVIGSLLGVRSAESSSAGASSEIEIRSCFALPHVENEEQVAMDMDYHKSMMELMSKVGGGREVIVGWYSSSPKITAHSALIQNFFTGETGITGPAVHLTFDTDLSQDNASSSLAVKAYVSQPIGTNPKPENCVFVPIPCSVKYQLTEKAGLDLLSPNTDASQASLPPLQTLQQSITALANDLAQIQTYVQEVTSGSRPADPKVGRYLLEAVGRWKSTDSSLAASSGPAGEDDEGEEGVKKGLQDVLSVSFLSSLVRTQAELSARLNLLV